MISKEKIKWISSLKLKKNRQNDKLFIVEGIKTADEILQSSHPFAIHAIYALSTWLSERRALLSAHQTKTHEVSPAELERISDLHTPNQVLMILQMPEIQPISLKSDHFYLVLDNIQDPGNLGTIIRIADWFGVSGLICSKGCAELYNSKVLQATMGSFLRIPVWEDVDLVDVLSQYQSQMPIYGAVLEGVNILTNPPKERRGLLVIGNESQGISAQVQALLSHRLTIPRFGAAESLNAAVATGILCSHFGA